MQESTEVRIVLGAEILKIPLSNRQVKDKLIWSLERDGVYSVKSAYNEWMKWQGTTSNAETSNRDTNNLINFWTHMWNANLPSKVKNFGWRVGHKFIHVADILLSRRVIDDATCFRCGKETETVEHAMWKCAKAEAVWKTAEVKACNLTPGAGTIQDFFVSLAADGDTNKLEKSIIIMWSIWFERNKTNAGDLERPPGKVANDALRYLTSYKEANNKKGKKRTAWRPINRWKKPYEGAVKINCDAAWKADRTINGIGLVARNAEGKHLNSRAIPVQNMDSSDSAEALATYYAVLAAEEWGYNEVIIESDSINTINRLSSSQEDLCLNGLIIEDTKHLMKNLSKCSVNHVLRQANKAAHDIARYACNLEDVETWNVCPPSFLQHVLQTDC